MRACYVAMPLGIKRDADGRELDFDFLYREVIQPAVQALDLECRRLEELSGGAIWHKTLFTALMSSDLMIADVSMQNPNVLYELGVRHALKRGRTFVIAARGTRLPWNISYVQALWYEPDQAGRLTAEPAEQFRQALQANIRQSQRTVISDSPIYEFFPELEVILPPALESAHRQRRRRPQAQRAFAESVAESPARAIDELKRNEAEVRREPQADPIEYLTLLRRYRDLSQWDELIALAAESPPNVKQSPEVRQLHALALNRRSNSGDQDRAIELMRELIEETGGDSETFGILGRIYKDRYYEATQRDDHDAAAFNLEYALNCYREGFAKNPKDYYPGINIVMLLLQRNDEPARAELAALVPQVRAVVREKLDSGRLDFWDLATDLQLAVVARDWSGAEETARLAMRQAPSGWMIESILRDLRALSNTLAGADERARFENILALLQQTDTLAGAVR
jgi:hypothetical protein